MFSSEMYAIRRIGASWAATCCIWFDPKSHIFAWLSHPAENIFEPSPDQALQRGGAWCVWEALGIDWPFCCTSQHRTWLSHDVATSRFDLGLKDKLETPSVGGWETSKSLFGL